MKIRKCFHTRRIPIYLIIFVFIVCICIFYQYRHFKELDDISNIKFPYVVIGVNRRQLPYYKKEETGNNFQCLNSKQNLDFQSVNDDYCDCVDGSDEPGTNACSFNQFNCAYKKPHLPEKLIPASRVNDGICDCCDGSDEWLMKTFQPIDSKYM